MKIFYEIPAKHQNGYLVEQRKYNYKALLIIGGLIHMIQLITYIASRVSPFTPDYEIMKGYLQFYEWTLLIDVVYLLLFLGIVYKIGREHRWTSILSLAYAFLLMKWAMGVAITDQFQGKEIVVYYVTMLFLAIIVDFKVKDFTIILLINQGIFIWMLSVFDQFIGSSTLIIQSSFQYILFGVVIRYYIGELRKKNYAHRQRLEDLNEELCFLSFYDSLSKLYNRRKWEENYQRMFQMSCDEQIAIDVLITDIDYFKNYNDTYGHVAGDQIIREVSRILIDATESYDRNVGRYGGDEFAISFVGLTEEDVHKMIADIKKRLASIIVMDEDGKQSHSVTMSFGCYRSIPTNTDQAWDFIVKADQHLYREKAIRHKID